MCMHIHLLYLFYLYKQVIWCTLYICGTRIWYSIKSHFFSSIWRVYLLEPTNTINEYKRKQIELIFHRYELRMMYKISCASNYFTLYSLVTYPDTRENSHILIEMKEKAKRSKYNTQKVYLKYVYVLCNAKDHWVQKSSQPLRRLQENVGKAQHITHTTMPFLL